MSVNLYFSFLFYLLYTNYHKLDGLKQWTFIPSEFISQKSEISISELKSRGQQASALAGGSGGKSILCLFQLRAAASSPWLVATPVSASKSHCLPYILSASLLKDPCDHI